MSRQLEKYVDNVQRWVYIENITNVGYKGENLW